MVAGVEAANSKPAGRRGAKCWTNSLDDVLVFGGYNNSDVNYSFGDLSDIWVFRKASSSWTWLAGPKMTDDNGNGIIPAARHGHIGGVDNSSQFWIIGGTKNGEDVFSAFSDIWRMNSCTNQLSLLSNFSSCMNCSAGKYPIFSLNGCDTCNGGKFSPGGVSPCLNCPNGTISNTNAASCTNCPIGRYQFPGNLECRPCPVGKFQDQIASTNCTSCIGSTTKSGGAISKDDCSICSENFFGDLPSIPCTICPVVKGIICPVGSKIPFVLPGYFRRGTSPPDLFGAIDCFPSIACDYTGFNISTSCFSGYTGYACGECESEFYRSGTVCKSCPSALVEAVTIAGLILLFCFIAFRLSRYRSQISPDIRVAIQSMQTLALFPNVTAKWPKSVLVLFRILSISVC
jgi:hypothetical protein